MPWRWIPPITAAGRTQMAIDRWMHQQLLAGGGPILRLYRWSRPTLSLGRHQQRWPEHWQALADAGQIELVRRPSGGRAVLHAGDLTYALVMLAPDRTRAQAYRHACSWLQQAFGAAGEPLHFGQTAAASAQQRSNCFATATAADLVDHRGAKRIGSAQLWQGTALLQHGSLLLEPPSQLWRAVFAELPPVLAPLPWDGDQLEQQLRRAAEAHLCTAPLREQPLSSHEWAVVQALEAACAPDQPSPLASIERATGPNPMLSG